MICPNCAQPMTEWKLTGHLGVQLTVDVCTTCQAFWFERHEDLGLTPASTLQLMKYIGDHSSTPSPRYPTTHVPALRLRAYSGAQHDPQRALRLLAMLQPARPLHQLL